MLKCLLTAFLKDENNNNINNNKNYELKPPNVETPQPPSNSKLHVYEKAAVCSDKNICSKIGR